MTGYFQTPEEKAEAKHRSAVEEDVKRELGPAPDFDPDWSEIFWGSIALYVALLMLVGTLFFILHRMFGDSVPPGLEVAVFGFFYFWFWPGILFFIIGALLKLTHGIRSDAYADRFKLLILRRMHVWRQERRALSKDRTITRAEALKALKDKGAVPGAGFTGWDTLLEHRTPDGEQLIGYFSNFAKEIFSLVKYGVLTKENWQAYFYYSRPPAGGSPELSVMSIDLDQNNGCEALIQKFLATLP